MATETFSWLTHPFFINVLLPFLLVFTVVYSILEKTAVLGKEKKYANLIISLIVGFMFIGVQSLVGFTLHLIPLIAIMIVILLGYFLVFGFIGIHENKGMKITLGILFGLAIISSILWASGLLDKITIPRLSSDAIALIVFLIIFGAAITLVLTNAPKAKKES